MMWVRYGGVKEYTDFRRTLWDAQNPDVPMPPVRQWFGPAAADEAEEDSDNELEVAQERISYQCPLTLRPFVAPVTTRVCKHSFEKDAIFEMIRNQRGGGIDCPVPGCSQKLTAKDLVEDEYLLAKMKRHEERMERERIQAQMAEEEEGEEEEEEEEEEGGEKPVSKEMKRVKKEKVAQPPAAKRRARAQVMDLSDNEEMED